MKVELEEENVHVNVIHGRKPFIMVKQKTGGNDLHERWGDDY